MTFNNVSRKYPKITTCCLTTLVRKEIRRFYPFQLIKLIPAGSKKKKITLKKNTYTKLSDKLGEVIDLPG
jgi:hypothetical protein